MRLAMTKFFERPILSTLLIAVAVMLIAYLWCYWPRRKLAFDFDPGGRRGEFENHAKRYQALARLLLTLCTATVAFLFSFLVNLPADPTHRNIYSLKLESACPRVVTCLGLSAACALLFLLFQNLFYEDYIHSKYTTDPKKTRETYSGERYALMLTFAAAGLFWFFFAYLFVAWKLFS
jgi:hypothetical protein